MIYGLLLTLSNYISCIKMHNGIRVLYAKMCISFPGSPSAGVLPEEG